VDDRRRVVEAPDLGRDRAAERNQREHRDDPLANGRRAQQPDE